MADYQARGYAVTGELYQTIFEMAWLLRGMENLLLDFHTNPAIAHAICEKLTQLRERQAVRYAESGVDILNPVQPECNDLMAIGRQSRTGPQRAARCFVGQLPRLHQLLEVPPGQRLIETTAQSGLPVGASLNCALEWCVLELKFKGPMNVRKLTLAGKLQPPGAYDATTAPGFLKGSGVLIVHPLLSLNHVEL